jgi:hypothetical protein
MKGKVSCVPPLVASYTLRPLYTKKIGPHYPLVANCIVTNAGFLCSEGRICDCARVRTLAVQPVYNYFTDSTNPVLITLLTVPTRL